MAIQPSSAYPSAPPRDALPSWRHSRALWAGISIITMWLAVLFVGIFGGDFISSSANGFTKIPVVVFLLPFVLPATIVVGRRGFSNATDDRPGAREEQRQGREEPEAEPSALRAKPA
jgi:hypothetical protein